VDIDTYADGSYKEHLVNAAAAEGYDPAHVAGNISAAFINGIVEKLNMDLPPAGQLALIPLVPGGGVQLGISYLDVGKNGYFTPIGSRYLIAKDAFDILAQRTFAMTAGASEEMMGAEQETWFLETIKGSDRTWKVWGTEYCLSQLAIDLGAAPAPGTLPASLKKKFYMNCDAWDGFRNRRSAILAQLAAEENVVAITGDIHAFYAGTPTVNDDATKKIVEFVGSSMSSKTFKEELVSQVASDPVLSTVEGSEALAGIIDVFLRNDVNPALAYANSGANGFCVAEVSAEEIVVTMHQIPAAEVMTNYTGRETELTDKIKQVRFKTVAGAHELYMEQDGAWKMWDPTTQAWV
jgi:alkaline phosphatase D